jgi:UDP-N-acetyl-2-amino-2-deoxyglucuronate dehydrogenase
MSDGRLPEAAELAGRRIRFGLVGCGRIADRHIEAIERHADRAELVAVCDTEEAARRRAMERTGVTGFSSLRQMLTNAEVDAAILATPSGLHGEQAIQVAAAGRHVITEKPMATRWKDGLAMVQACDHAGVRLFVVKQNRRNPTIQLLKRAVERGRFGRIYLVNVNVLWNRPQSYYDSAPWRGTWEFDGGAFMNQASHYIDLLDWLIGPVQSISAFTATLARNIQVEDTGVANVRWRSGALGSVSVTMLTHPKNYEGSITVIGEKGTVRVGGVAVNQIEHWAFDSADPDDAKVADASYQTTSVYGHGHVGYYDNVIQTLRGEAVAETDGREGLRSLELLIGIYLSARDGQPVSLPLDF